MRALLDVNALLALMDGNHIHHKPMHEWWADNHQFGWASCPLTQNGFLRIASQPRYVSPMPLAEAFKLLEMATTQGSHEFWPDDLSLTEAYRFERKRLIGPKQLTDIYLLGLAVKNNGRLVTFDRAMSRESVRGAEPKHLVVLP